MEETRCFYPRIAKDGLKRAILRNRGKRRFEKQPHTGFIKKPFQQKELVAALREVMEYRSD